MNRTAQRTCRSKFDAIAGGVGGATDEWAVIIQRRPCSRKLTKMLLKTVSGRLNSKSTECPLADPGDPVGVPPRPELEPALGVDGPDGRAGQPPDGPAKVGEKLLLEVHHRVSSHHGGADLEAGLGRPAIVGLGLDGAEQLVPRRRPLPEQDDQGGLRWCCLAPRCGRVDGPPDQRGEPPGPVFALPGGGEPECDTRQAVIRDTEFQSESPSGGPVQAKRPSGVRGKGSGPRPPDRTA